MTDINARIQDYITKDDIVLFMKGTPIFPQCGFSSVVSQVLQHLGVNYESYNVLEDMELREGIKDFSDWPTIPQVYIKGEFIGGCDIIKEMFESGELQQLVTEKGLN
ncbi:Grx4 family monothiol glutaredoxin [Temperatibacter marinus]|uniref:Glutaredoxin n=1 Tax=Temperatibacter marinus TaxID=1456591 RepID=A0AA52EFS9_9PROT|nr:Grx4 family monothiol glutaredoxin [Temperatibacter marinus]WND02313.1 Grx4 family monothiol glutaredoxin [Temperatibacter marinus]